MRLLFAVDSFNDKEKIRAELQFLGHTVDMVDYGKKALALNKEKHYDAILLDPMLLDIQGVKFLTILRNTGKITPVIILVTSTDDHSKRISLLRAGADAYIVTPCLTEYIDDKIKESVNRDDVSKIEPITCEGIEIDTRLKRVKILGKDVYFPNKTYEILEYLMLNKGKDMKKEEIYDHVYPGDFFNGIEKPGIENIYVQIFRIREIIRRAGIEEEVINNLGKPGYTMIDKKIRKTPVLKSTPSISPRPVGLFLQPPVLSREECLALSAFVLAIQFFRKKPSEIRSVPESTTPALALFNVLELGEITINTESSLMSSSNGSVVLSPKELKLFKAYGGQPNLYIPHPIAICMIWEKESSEGDTNKLRQLIFLCRRKLEKVDVSPMLLDSQPGYGFRLIVRTAADGAHSLKQAIDCPTIAPALKGSNPS